MLAAEGVVTPWLRTYHADLLDAGFAEIPDESVGVVVTSPPYKMKDGYSNDLMEALGRLVGRVLAPGGRLFLNFGQLREGFDRPFVAQDVVQDTSGLKPGQTIAWVKSVAIDGVQKGHYQPLNTQKVLNYAWEPIFTYFKPPEGDLDRLAIGVPFADKGNLKRGSRGKHGDFHCAGDVWFVPYKTTGKTKKKAHGYEFPEELVRRCLLIANPPRPVVLEPFLGSGTTVCVAKRLGLNAYGIERDGRILCNAVERWDKE